MGGNETLNDCGGQVAGTRDPSSLVVGGRDAAGMIAKYVATSFAMLKLVSEPRVISICLPVSTTSINFVGLESRSTILPLELVA